MIEALIFFIITLLSSIAGSTSGLGGGFVLRPVLELVSDMDVVHISFLSSVTVFCVALTALLRQRKLMKDFKFNVGVPIAIGSVIGGLIGSWLFDLAGETLASAQSTMMIASIVLLLALLVLESKISPLALNKGPTYVLLGIGLGIFAAFLGIGGGPLNLAALTLFLSMDIKTAALYSIFIILFAQGTNLLRWVFFSGLLGVPPVILVAMSLAGVTGAVIGSWLYKKADNKKIKILYAGIMLFVLAVSIANLVRAAFA